MTTLTRRPSRSGAYYRTSAFTELGVSATKLFAEIVDLVMLNNATGQLDEDTLVFDLQKFFDAPEVDRARDLHLWRDSSGKVIGFGLLLLMPEKSDEIEGYLYFDVHPAWQGDSLGCEILQWSEQRMREVGEERAVRVKLRTRSRNDKIVRRVLLEQQGFTTERCFLTMAYPLVQPFSSSSLPTGFKLQQLSTGRDLKAWVELFNESFIDHWDHQDLTVATVKHWLENPYYKPELNLIAVSPEGTFAGFCLGYINHDENVRTGRNEGWIKLLGTRRSFRKRGLGRAILLAQMRQLKAAGVERVKLGVDDQSLTSATQLYQSVGFYSVNTWLSYVKEIQF